MGNSRRPVPVMLAFTRKENVMRLMIVAVALLISFSAAGQDTVYAPGNGVTLPALQKNVQPDYTPEAKRRQIQGTVFLKAVVLADGTVGEVTVERSLDTTYGLDEQAVKAMKQWLFTPGKKDGKPVAVRVSVEMTFTLKR